ncbi:MAG: 2-C-methyl-D-erythritol 4-phosphate cytidylyltransferase, partial [Aliidongia sp.]|nr:2-C-methyl-D-erythritol 4-phosphate cytidylyltransferase [Aliidongia sp.]
MTKHPPPPRCHVLIVAAGRGSRFGGPLPKQYCLLAGQPVLRHTVAAFRTRPDIVSIRVAIHPDDRALYDAAVGDLGLPEPVPGGALRQDSVRNLLMALDAEPDDIVLIHDGARPLVSAAIIDATLSALTDA